MDSNFREPKKKTEKRFQRITIFSSRRGRVPPRKDRMGGRPDHGDRPSGGNWDQDEEENINYIGRTTRKGRQGLYIRTRVCDVRGEICQECDFWVQRQDQRDREGVWGEEEV